ncbi:MAPEG family protein [Agarivorans sp.]|uniref:MAPEG family protein n=1 Tax=Agarivorans sp. TaxID=1872412 RepID=UPI003D00AFF4
MVTFLPILLAFLGAYTRFKYFGYFDNANPRVQAQELSGRGARVIASQTNAWEALALYSASILIVFASGVSWSEITNACLVFLLARIAHPILYIQGYSTARSMAFAVGFFSCVYIVWQAF